MEKEQKKQTKAANGQETYESPRVEVILLETQGLIAASTLDFDEIPL